MAARFVFFIPAKVGISAVLFLFGFLAGCGGGVNILPEPFTRERADGKIPVKTELIRQQVRAELDGIGEGEAEVARWQAIETDYNACRLSSAETTKSKAEQVFANCMSERGYVYMFPIDAEQFHNDIAEEEDRLYPERKRAAEERRLAAEKAAKEERKEAERNAEQKRLEVQLVAAAVTGNLLEVRRLLADGVNPNAVGKSDLTPLMGAAQGGHINIVKILLAEGAYLEWTDNDGTTALILAAAFGHAEVVKVILSYKPYLEHQGSNGGTALILAADSGHSNIVQILLSAGAQPNTMDNGGDTALMRAVGQGNDAIVKLLLSAHANPNLGNNHGVTPLTLAVVESNYSIAEILLKADANPNHVFSDGFNVMDGVLYTNHPEMIRLFRQHGGVCRLNC